MQKYINVSDGIFRPEAERLQNLSPLTMGKILKMISQTETP